MSAASNIVEVQCNRCLIRTKHDVKGMATYEDYEEVKGHLAYYEKTVSELLQCRGCGHVTMRQTHEESGMDEPDVEQYPAPISRRRPQWLQWFIWGEPKDTLRELFAEVYSALFAKNYRLAAMGTRAIIDVVLTDKLGDIGGFERKLEEAKKLGIIVEKHHEILVAAVDAGSAAAHRAFKPDPKQIATVLDIVESTVQLLYVLEPSAKQLAQTVPIRGATLSSRPSVTESGTLVGSRKPFNPST